MTTTGDPHLTCSKPGCVATHIPHADWCEGDTGHDYDCGTATKLAKLTAFAEAVRDEFKCTEDGDQPRTADHLSGCWHCVALDALETPR